MKVQSQHNGDNSKVGTIDPKDTLWTHNYEHDTVRVELGWITLEMTAAEAHHMAYAMEKTSQGNLHMTLANYNATVNEDKKMTQVKWNCSCPPIPMVVDHDDSVAQPIVNAACPVHGTLAKKCVCGTLPNKHCPKHGMEAFEEEVKAKEIKKAFESNCGGCHLFGQEHCPKHGMEAVEVKSKEYSYPMKTNPVSVGLATKDYVDSQIGSLSGIQSKAIPEPKADSAHKRIHAMQKVIAEIIQEISSTPGVDAAIMKRFKDAEP